METTKPIRLNKFLAERLGFSRREADELIASGEISVNDQPAKLGQKITEKDKIFYAGRLIPFAVGYIYLALNKPVGYVSSRRRQGETPTLYELLPTKYQHLKTVGRLDRDSSGLILLTNDGDFAFQMTHPKFVKNKLYRVRLDKPLEPLHQQMLADFGVELADGRSQLGLRRLDESRELWEATLHEGRNRQIRRSFAALGYRVAELHRTQFGKYALSGLKDGEWTEIAK
ncbi:rRNA pseudouridine synthase [Candidatus Saccharibacteria bacterium]|nr:rRNA pseudouridine synthase [Candidatus Saccharibacteria bacterium]